MKILPTVIISALIGAIVGGLLAFAGSADEKLVHQWQLCKQTSLGYRTEVEILQGKLDMCVDALQGRVGRE